MRKKNRKKTKQQKAIAEDDQVQPDTVASAAAAEPSALAIEEALPPKLQPELEPIREEPEAVSNSVEDRDFDKQRASRADDEIDKDVIRESAPTSDLDTKVSIYVDKKRSEESKSSRFEKREKRQPESISKYEEDRHGKQHRVLFQRLQMDEVESDSDTCNDNDDGSSSKSFEIVDFKSEDDQINLNSGDDSELECSQVDPSFCIEDTLIKESYIQTS